MKLLFILTVSLILSNICLAQTDPPHQLASKIAQKMKDSLNLSGAQKEAVKNINLNLSEQKMQARGTSKDRMIVGKSLQTIENKRDSLYKTILTPEQNALYHTKKRNLVTNNK
jgi:hypothetical protein